MDSKPVRYSFHHKTPLSFSESIFFFPLTAVRFPMLLFPDNLLTSWIRVLLDELTGSQLVKKFRAF